MKNFNLNRFGHVVRLDVQTHRKRYVKYLLVLYIASLFVELVNFYKPSRYGTEHVGATLDTAAQLFTVFMSWAMLVGASTLFENLKTKGGRQAELTLPATNLERFLSRYLIVTVGIFVLFLAGFVAADLTRMAVMPLLGHSLPSALPAFFDLWLGPDDHILTIDGAPVSRMLYAQLCLMVTLGMVLTHACYLAGSSLLRKNAFVLTTLVLFALLVFTGWFTVEAIGHRFEVFTSLTSEWQLGCVNFVLLALIVGCYWLTWRRFCRIQVITRKWWRP